ncbi:MAG: hypothetical protein AAAC48_18775, partial [Phyllobacterium sp.]|uniref:hypothetical protein n=1 Tax=Phyllobacterium sp. TaxID=1871046 RepID=UPI0030F095D0
KTDEETGLMLQSLLSDINVGFLRSLNEGVTRSGASDLALKCLNALSWKQGDNAPYCRRLVRRSYRESTLSSQSHLHRAPNDSLFVDPVAVILKGNDFDDIAFLASELQTLERASMCPLTLARSLAMKKPTIPHLRHITRSKVVRGEVPRRSGQNTAGQQSIATAYTNNHGALGSIATLR